MEIRKSYTLPFATDLVYSAWVSSDTVIAPATAMDIDPQVGGHYRLIIEGEDFTARNEGHFLVVEPEQRVQYTWEWNGDGEVTQIDVRFSDVDVGTQVTLVHSGFSSKESLQNHDGGWDSYVEGLIRHLGGR